MRSPLFPKITQCGSSPNHSLTAKYDYPDAWQLQPRVLVVLDVRFAFELELFVKIVGSLTISLARVELGLAKFLQVSRLGVNEELVDLGNPQIIDQAKIDAHSHLGKVFHRFFASDLLRVL